MCMVEQSEGGGISGAETDQPYNIKSHPDPQWRIEGASNDSITASIFVLCYCHNLAARRRLWERLTACSRARGDIRISATKDRPIMVSANLLIVETRKRGPQEMNEISTHWSPFSQAES